jgi:hypothetical protein
MLSQFKVITENKLNAKDRNALPDKIFGLPDERKYPLNDEEHVRAAIKFFKYCPSAKRNILAANINKQAKQFGIQLNISKDNPFFKLADKSIVLEVATPYDNTIIDALMATHIPRYDVLPLRVKAYFDKLIKAIILKESDLISLEKEVAEIIIPHVRETYKQGIETNQYLLNPIKTINEIMDKIYNLFLDFDFYIEDNSLRETNDIFYEIIKDLCFTISHKVYEQDKNIGESISILNSLTKNFSCNLYYVNRKLEEVIFDCYIANKELRDTNETSADKFSILSKIEQQIKDVETRLNEFIPNVTSVINSPKEIMDSVLYSSNLNLLNTENYLNTLKNELKSQINIILMSNVCGCSISFMNCDYDFYLKDVPRENREIFDILNMLSDSLREGNIKFYNKDYSLALDSKTLVAYSNLKSYIETIYPSKNNNSEPVYFGLKDDKLYLLAMNEKQDNELILVKLYDGVNLNTERYFLTDDRSCLGTIKIIKISMFQKNLDQTLTEGVSIDQQGNIKFEIKPKKSYMDEYAENHKLLVENSKNKNYEGMKKNLAFLFALINSIERDVMYVEDKKIPDNKKKDAQKARTFAINDFKTYLKEVQKAESGFDFTKYYDESGYDKLIVNIPNESILGIKKLFRSIMLA